MTHVHTESENMPWEINVGDHAKRADTPWYDRARKLMIALVKQCQPWRFGPPPYQDHHGGGIWLRDANGWFMVLGPIGLEWSGQFCADPAKIDLWRQDVARVVAGFPLTLPGYMREGYPDGVLLRKEIKNADDVSHWVDSIFNASVPLPALDHTGVLPKGGGYHHYPKPIKDIDVIKHDDFTLWVVDPASGQPVAVAPVAPRGSGDGRVQILYATPGTELHAAKAAAHDAGETMIVDATHPLAQQAYQKQGV